MPKMLDLAEQCESSFKTWYDILRHPCFDASELEESDENLKESILLFQAHEEGEEEEEEEFLPGVGIQLS